MLQEAARKVTLYDLSSELVAAIAETDEGEVPEGLEDRLDSLEGDFTTKVDACLAYMRERAGRAEIRRLEAKRLAALAQCDENAADSIKRYVQRCLEMTGTKRMSTGRFDMTVAQSPPSAKLADGLPIPAQFKRIKEEFDKSAAVAAWKAGEPLPAGVTVEQSHHLRVR